MIGINYYQKIFEHAPLALLLVDKELNNIETNAEFCRITGVSQKAILTGLTMVPEMSQVSQTIGKSVDTLTSAANRDLAATTRTITAAVRHVPGFSGTAANEAGDAAAAAEESSAALDEIARMVGLVDATAVAAMEANRKFRIG